MRDSSDTPLLHSRHCSECGSYAAPRQMSRGLCKSCYMARWYAGTLPPLARRPSWTLDPVTGCWLWHRLRGDGYIQLTRSGRSVYAHRWYYELYVDPIPDGMELDHLCRVRHCVNPAHLEPVTPAVNTLRGLSPSARFARATHCVNGHPFDAANTVVTPKQRVCRTCRRKSGYRAYLVRKARKAQAA